jgi:hypothetical protein
MLENVFATGTDKSPEWARSGPHSAAADARWIALVPGCRPRGNIHILDGHRFVPRRPLPSWRQARSVSGHRKAAGGFLATIPADATDAQLKHLRILGPTNFIRN